MKKLIFTLAVLFCVITMSAQESRMWVGGTAGIWSSKEKGEDSKLSFQVKPEFGYILNDNMAVGISIGAGHAQAADLLGNDNLDGSANVYIVNPFLRYTFLKGSMGALFIDGGFAWNHINVCGGEDNNADMYEIGIRPGVALNISQKFALIGKFGFLGYQHSKTKGWNQNDFGLNLNLDDVEFGICFKF